MNTYTVLPLHFCFVLLELQKSFLCVKHLVSIVNVYGTFEFDRERHLSDDDLITKQSQASLVLGQCM